MDLRVEPGRRQGRATRGHVRLDGIYPEGFRSGRSRVERGNGLYKEIGVRPAVDFSGARRRARRPRAGARRAPRTTPAARRGHEVRAAAVVVALLVALALQTTLAGCSSAGPRRSTWCWWSSSSRRWSSGRPAGLLTGTAAGSRRMRCPAGSSASAGSPRRWSGSGRRVRVAVHRGQPLPRLRGVRGGASCTSCASWGCTRSSSARRSAAVVGGGVQAAVNALVGILVFQVGERGPAC